MTLNLQNIRKNYKKGSLQKSDLSNNPIYEFQKWLEEAISQNCIEPTATTLSTVSEGKPSGRIVLLKQIDEKNRFCFFTNYNSRKGCDLTINNNAALTFFWAQMERQVRVEGTVKRIPHSINAEYFNSRPLEHRIAACISPQSKIIDSREWLDRKFESTKHLKPTCPTSWGGFALIANEIEFWQGGANRLHDRIKFVLKNNKWSKFRLAP